MLSAWILVGFLGADAPPLESPVCEGEVARLCPGLKGDALEDCYAQHVLDFKDPCRAAVYARTESLAKLCVPAQERLCPNNAQLADCLRTHVDEFPEPCRAPLRKNLQALPAARRKLDTEANAAFPCRPFIQQFCKDLAARLLPSLAECFKSGEPDEARQCPAQRELAACLQSHRSELSKSCLADLKKWGSPRQ